MRVEWAALSSAPVVHHLGCRRLLSFPEAAVPLHIVGCTGHLGALPLATVVSGYLSLVEGLPMAELTPERLPSCGSGGVLRLRG